MIGDINMYQMATKLTEGKWYRLSLDGCSYPMKLVQVTSFTCVFEVMGVQRYYPLDDLLGRIESNKLWVEIDIVRSLAEKLAASDNNHDVESYIKYAQIAVDALK